MKVNDFDRIAFLYDGLAKLVFGRSVIRAQKYFLDRITEPARILVVGGGTGWIVAEIIKIKTDVSVCYIEASAKMIEIAKKKTNDDERIQFILGSENDIPSDKQFDFIITNFYFDLFTNRSLKVGIGKIAKSAVPTAKWIATDFTNDRWWKKLILKTMYLFFRVTCNIESRELPAWREALLASGVKPIESKKFYNGFIETSFFHF